MEKPVTTPKLSLERVFGDPEFYIVPPGVIRYDHYHTHGWWSRMQRQRANLRTFFSDGLHGSIENALRAAIKNQQELIDAFGTEVVVSSSRQLPIDPRDRIYRKVDKPKGNGSPFEYWLARWYDQDYKIQSKRFAVKRYGEEAAKAMALSIAGTNHNKAPKPARAYDVFANLKWKPYSRADVLRASEINTEPQRNETRTHFEQVDAFAFEGAQNFILHQQIERDKKLRSAKILDFIDKHGKIHCEICLFNFQETYSFLENDIIQVHHQTPLSELKESTKTTLSDLMLICANCHFAIHQGDAVDNVIAALDIFSIENK